jgi:hypothetical protein
MVERATQPVLVGEDKGREDDAVEHPRQRLLLQQVGR